MAENRNGRKYPTWQYLAGVLILVVVGVVGWAFTDTRACMEKKVDKEVYYRDVGEIKQDIKDIKDFLIKRRP